MRFFLGYRWLFLFVLVGWLVAGWIVAERLDGSRCRFSKIKKKLKFSLWKFRGPKWSYFVNFRCTGPWVFSLTSLMDDPALYMLSERCLLRVGRSSTISRNWSSRWKTLASLGLMSPGAATDGVTPSNSQFCSVSQKLTAFFSSLSLIDFTRVSPSPLEGVTADFFTCPTSFLNCSL